jgi:hypothetical protein
MTRGAPRTGRVAGIGALLAFLALFVAVVTPPGFMAASRGSVPAIVICTGHGPAVLPGDAGGGLVHRSGKSGHDGACAFAGHGLTTSPPVLAVIDKAAFAHIADPDAALADLAPGRGLAAPPPPSQGPPVLT